MGNAIFVRFIIGPIGPGLRGGIGQFIEGCCMLVLGTLLTGPLSTPPGVPGSEVQMGGVDGGGIGVGVGVGIGQDWFEPGTLSMGRPNPPGLGSGGLHMGGGGGGGIGVGVGVGIGQSVDDVDWFEPGSL